MLPPGHSNRRKAESEGAVAPFEKTVSGWETFIERHWVVCSGRILSNSADIIEQGSGEAERIGFYVLLVAPNLILADPGRQLSENLKPPAKFEPIGSARTMSDVCSSDFAPSLTNIS